MPCFAEPTMGRDERGCRAARWLANLCDGILYTMKSPRAFRARRLSLPSIFTPQGTLVAPVVQGCLIHKKNS